MNTKTQKKQIIALVSSEDAGINLKNVKLPGTPEDKLKFTRSILEIPKNYNDNIEVMFLENDIKFIWSLENVDINAERAHKNALVFARKNNLEKAVILWEKASSINQHDPDYFFNLGIVYFELKRFTDAIENLMRVLTICPIYYKAHLILGTSYLKIRKFEFAKKHFQKSIIFNKTNPISFLNLGAVNRILKLYDEGIQMFERAISITPNETRAYLGLAKIYSTIGNTEKSNLFFKKVIELDNTSNLANYARRSITTIEEHKDDISLDRNPEEYYSDGYQYYINGNYEKSALMYQKYLTKKPNDEYIWYALGEAQLRNNQLEKALESLKKAIDLHPKKGLYYKELAIVYDKLNEPEKVINSLLKAEELGKIDSITYCLWGKALYDQQNYDEAITILEQALKKNRNNFLARYCIANAYYKNNNLDEAIENLSELQNIKINTPFKLKSKKLYKKLTQN